MLPEISLSILDITQNSIKAQASLIELFLHRKVKEKELVFRIRDNGCGMNPQQLANVTDPFFTSRTTRKVGLGVPFLKQSAECTGGVFEIESEEGVGTMMYALFHTDHIDCMPLGDITSTILSLVTLNEQCDFVYTYQVDDRSFMMDTREFRAVLGDDISFAAPDVRDFIQEFLMENKKETDAGLVE